MLDLAGLLKVEDRLGAYDPWYRSDMVKVLIADATVSVGLSLVVQGGAMLRRGSKVGDRGRAFLKKRARGGGVG